MEAIRRITTNHDWITLILLGILFFIVFASFLDKQKLKQLFALPYNNYYLLNYAASVWDLFSIILFISSNLILALFVYLIQFNDLILPDATPTLSFLKILFIIALYWVVKFISGKLIANLFGLTKVQTKWRFLKASYFYSSSIYLLILLFFAIYFFDNTNNFIIVTGVIYSILLAIRYYHFINRYKKLFFTYFFYFILYLCALEIAPLLIVLKISF